MQLSICKSKTHRHFILFIEIYLHRVSHHSLCRLRSQHPIRLRLPQLPHPVILYNIWTLKVSSQPFQTHVDQNCKFLWELLYKQEQISTLVPISFLFCSVCMAVIHNSVIQNRNVSEILYNGIILYHFKYFFSNENLLPLQVSHAIRAISCYDIPLLWTLPFYSCLEYKCAEEYFHILSHQQIFHSHPHLSSS